MTGGQSGCRLWFVDAGANQRSWRSPTKQLESRGPCSHARRSSGQPENNRPQSAVIHARRTDGASDRTQLPKPDRLQAQEARHVMRGEAADPIKARSMIALKTGRIDLRIGCRRTPPKHLAREASIECRQGWRARSSRGLAQGHRADCQIEHTLLMRKHMLDGAANLRLHTPTSPALLRLSDQSATAAGAM